MPHRSPTQLEPRVVARIETSRRERTWSARQIAIELARQDVSASVSTVGRWLVRLGLNDRRFLDPDGGG